MIFQIFFLFFLFQFPEPGNLPNLDGPLLGTNGYLGTTGSATTGATTSGCILVKCSGGAVCLKKYILNIKRRESWTAQMPPTTSILFLESRVLLRSAQYVEMINKIEVTALYIIKTQCTNSFGMAPHKRLAKMKLLKLYAYMPIPWRIGTSVSFPLPKNLRTTLSASGKPIPIPNSMEMLAGTIAKV